jgi:Glycosyltransferase like family 2
MATLTAIVPATDGPPTLARCRAAIAAAAQPPDEVIVIEGPPGASPAAARNAGAGRASSDVLVFVDSDVLVHADAFVRIRAAFELDPRLAAVFGSYDLASGDGGPVTAFRNLLLREVHHQCAGPATTFWSGLGAIRRGAFETAGGFNADRYPRPSIEDIDLGRRLTERGARIELDPRIRGTHLKRWGVGGMVRTDLLDRAVPWMRLALESGRVPAAMNLRWRHRLSAVASAAGTLALLGRRPRTVAASALALLALNHAFYGRLRRRYGWRTAAAGFGLHVVHHLTSMLGAAGALAVHLRARLR